MRLSVKKTGPGEVSLTAAATAAKSGAVQHQQQRRDRDVQAALDEPVEPARRVGAGDEQRLVAAVDDDRGGLAEAQLEAP